jgi:hypothetical protein
MAEAPADIRVHRPAAGTAGVFAGFSLANGLLAGSVVPARLSCACGRLDGEVQDFPGNHFLVVEERPDLPGYVPRVAQ